MPLDRTPNERGAGFEFVDAVKGGVIPSQFIPAVEKGVRQAMAAEAVAGFPMQDIRVIVYDGKSAPVDGKEVAFIAAGKRAYQKAVARPGPSSWSPSFGLSSLCREECFGDVSGNLSARRGQLTGSNSGRGGMVILEGLVPLAELNNCQSRLKAMTGGRGSYTMELADYQVVPPNVQQRLAAQYRPSAEED